MKLLLALAALLALSSSFAREGGSEGGGGDVVILPDGSVVLADSYLDVNAPQPNNMPKQVALNPKLILQVKTYTEYVRKLMQTSGVIQEKESDLLKIFDEVGKNSVKLAFYSVADAPELNDFCASGGRKVYRLENGERVEQVACTAGTETFFVVPLLKRMALVQQALLIFHERLTTLRDTHGGKNYQAIAGFTSGLHKVLEVAFEQQQGKFRRLSPEEVTRIRGFYESIFELEYRSREPSLGSLNFRVHPNGGGLIKGDLPLDESVFLGITSVLEDQAIVGAGSVILDTVVPAGAELEKNVRLKQVEFIHPENIPIFIGPDSQIEKTTFDFTKRLLLGANTKIIKSVVKLHSLEAAENLTLIKSEINLFPKDRYGSRTPGEPGINLRSHQTMNEGEMNILSLNDFAPLGSPLKYMNESLTVKSNCQGRLKDFLKDRSQVKECYQNEKYIQYQYRYKEEVYEEEGYTYTMTPELGILVVENNKFERDWGLRKGDRIIVLRSMKLSLVFTELKMPSAASLYMLKNDELIKAGEYNKRTLTFGYHWTTKEAAAFFTSRLKAQGATVGAAYAHGVEDAYTVKLAY